MRFEFGYKSLLALAAVHDLCDRRLAGELGTQAGMNAMASDEEIGRQILGVFMKFKVRPNGVLRRNYFMDVRDADFQRGLSNAVKNNWIKIKLRDRYSYELTEAGLAAGRAPAESTCS